MRARVEKVDVLGWKKSITKHLCFPPVFYCTYWPVLGSLNKCNIIQFSNKATSSGYFDAVHMVVLDSIRDNISSLVQLGKCCSINSADPITMGYYVIKYLSEIYILKEDQTTYGKVIKAGGLVVKAE